MDPCHTPGPGDEPPAADVVGLQRARRTRTTGGRNGPRPDSDDDIRGTPRAYERRCAPELRTTSAIVGGLLALTMLVLSTGGDAPHYSHAPSCTLEGGLGHAAVVGRPPAC